MDNRVSRSYPLPFGIQGQDIPPLGLLLEDAHFRWDWKANWVLCLRLLKRCHLCYKTHASQGAPDASLQAASIVVWRASLTSLQCQSQPVLARPQYRCVSPKARVQHCMLTRWISCNIDARLDPKGKPLKIKERRTTFMFLWGVGCGPRK